MSETPVKGHRKVRVLTVFATAVSVLVAAAWWFYLTVPASEWFPNYEYHYEEVIVALAFAVAVAICLNIAGGSRGGIDRRICVLAGLVLLSPLVWLPFSAS